MRTTWLPVLVLVGILLPTMALPEPPPPVPPEGLIHYKQEPCVDAESGLDGTCFYSHDMKNNRYRAFYVKELAWAIYQLKDGQYVEIWRRGADT